MNVRLTVTSQHVLPGRIENWLNVYDSGGDVDDGQLDELIFLPNVNNNVCSHVHR